MILEAAAKAILCDGLGCILDVSTGLGGYLRTGVLGFPSTDQMGGWDVSFSAESASTSGVQRVSAGLAGCTGRFIASWALGDSATCMLLTEC